MEDRWYRKLCPHIDAAVLPWMRAAARMAAARRVKTVDVRDAVVARDHLTRDRANDLVRLAADDASKVVLSARRQRDLRSRPCHIMKLLRASGVQRASAAAKIFFRALHDYITQDMWEMIAAHAPSAGAPTDVDMIKWLRDDEDYRALVASA